MVSVLSRVGGGEADQLGLINFRFLKVSSRVLFTLCGAVVIITVRVLM